MSDWISVKDRLPEHYRHVLAYYVNDYGKARIVRAAYIYPRTEVFSNDDYDGDLDYDEKTDMYYLPAGWIEENEHEDTHWIIDEEVLCWMPLPDPPKEAP